MASRSFPAQLSALRYRYRLCNCCDCKSPGRTRKPPTRAFAAHNPKRSLRDHRS